MLGGRKCERRGLKGGRKQMSVIGRLDDQVEEVLIAPIARRHEQEAREREKEKRAPQEDAPKTATEEEQERNSE